MPTVSIIIASRNRVDSLRETLASLRQMEVPLPYDVELLLVDNGSVDGTGELMHGFSAESLTVRVLDVPRPGKARALNRALAVAEGSVLLFTDDDVRVPVNWVAGMVSPILTGEADAVAGGVHLADWLRRSWMTTPHSLVLAETACIDPESPRLVGANMAIERSVFDRISGFDQELGPGKNSTGTHEETLLSLQLQAGGMRIVSAFDVSVEHHPSPDRLTRSGLAAAMERVGYSVAYVDYHWRHEEASRMRSAAAFLYWTVRLAAWRLAHPIRSIAAIGMAPTEMEFRRYRAYHQRMLSLVGLPRAYDYHGLNKTPSGTAREAQSLSLKAGSPV